MTADTKDERGSRPKSPRTGNRGDAKAREGNVGHALRHVYQQTVSEDVPSDLLDLLGKLA